MPTVPRDTAPLAEWAQWYAAQGWPVFPCRGKLPRTQHGHHDATSDTAQIATWWHQWPTANIGCPSGPHWWGLDVDPKNQGDDTLFRLQAQHGLLPHTLLSHTGGGGTHYFWLPPASPVQNKAAIGDGLDVQAEGMSYLILPPSIHPDTGKAYLWDLVDGPDDIMPQPAPAWLEALVTHPNGHPVSARPAAAPGSPIPDRVRNTTLAQMAGAMRRQGMTAEEILIALAIINQRCAPPLDQHELSTIAHSIERYPPAGQLVPSSHAAPNMSQPPAQASAVPFTLASTPASRPRKPLTPTDLADMLERTYPRQQWLIQDLIPEGLTFFVGSPKSSKTYLAYSLALSLAHEAIHGGSWLNTYEVLHPGPVVYVTLEDDEADSRNRIAELMPDLAQIPRERFLFLHGFDLPRFHEGLVEDLRTQIIERYHPALLVLDPISYLYAPTKKGGDQFTEVIEMLLPLRALGKDYHCAVLGVDHRRKKSADDVDIFETTYGSNAKIAVADSLLMIVRDQGEITIHARVRKAVDQTLTLGLTFDEHGCAHWEFKGAVDGLLGADTYGECRVKVCALLAGQAGRAFSLEDIILELGWVDSKQTRNQIKQALFRAEKAREIGRAGRNQYVWAGGVA